MQARLDSRIAVGMSKDEAIQKMTDIDFECQEGKGYLSCSRVSKGIAHENHYAINLTLSADGNTVTAISKMQFAGMAI